MLKFWVVPTVDNIVSSFKKTVNDLETLAQAEEDAINSRNSRIQALVDKNKASEKEAVRARNISAKLNALLS